MALGREYSRCLHCHFTNSHLTRLTTLFCIRIRYHQHDANMQAKSNWHENHSPNSPDPGLDEAYLETYQAPVYLTTINLAQSEVSYNHVTPVLRFFLPGQFKIVKHWGILVRETLYELSRDPSNLTLGVGLNTSRWQDVKSYHDPPLKIGTTTMSDEEILAIGILTSTSIAMRLLSKPVLTQPLCSNGAILAVAKARLFGHVLQLSVLLLSPLMVHLR